MSMNKNENKYYLDKNLEKLSKQHFLIIIK